MFELSTHLVHFLQLHRDQTEAGHELVQSLLSKSIIYAFLIVTELRDLVQVLGTFQELFFALSILFQNTEIGLCVFEFF